MTTHTITYGCGHSILVNGTLGSATIASCLAVLCDECCYQSFIKNPDGLRFYCVHADPGHDNDIISNVTARKFFSYKWVHNMMLRVLRENPDISKMYLRRNLSHEDPHAIRLSDREELSIAAESALTKYPEMSKECALCSTEAISETAFPFYLKTYPEEAVKYLTDTTYRGIGARELLMANA